MRLDQKRGLDHVVEALKLPTKSEARPTHRPAGAMPVQTERPHQCLHLDQLPVKDPNNFSDY
jgi:hypothetical protein